MMGLKFKLKRNKKVNKKLSKKLKQLDKQYVDVGHFKESGTHSVSGIKYSDLMWIHHFGLGGQRPRKIKALMLARLKLTESQYVKAMKQWGKSKLSASDSATLLDSFGQSLMRQEKAMFGKVTPNTPATKSRKRVAKNGPTAPLIDSGELRANTGYKTSTDKKVKGGR